MTPTDEDFDDMHHAIGRKGVKAAYRNNFCTQAGGEQAKRFEALGFWNLGTTINGGRDAIYVVNQTGLAALETWLKERSGETCGMCKGSGYSNHPDSGEVCAGCGGSGGEK